MANTDEALIDQALESMENDARPFVRVFIIRNEQSDRELSLTQVTGCLWRGLD